MCLCIQRGVPLAVPLFLRMLQILQLLQLLLMVRFDEEISIDGLIRGADIEKNNTDTKQSILLGIELNNDHMNTSININYES